jgi:type II secretory pathway pseudopilin PulG
VELITVIVIAGVLGAIAAPVFLGTSRPALPGAARMIQADIRYAQASAMTEGASKTVTFSSGGTSYTVVAEVVDLPSGVTISGNYTVTFNSLGEPTTGGGGSVTIAGGGDNKTISVSNYTGRATIS